MFSAWYLARGPPERDISTPEDEFPEGAGPSDEKTAVAARVEDVGLISSGGGVRVELFSFDVSEGVGEGFI